jgi:hypothetical protein
VPLLTQTERDFVSGTRQFTKPQIRYIRCRLKKKLRLLGDELQSFGIPYSWSVAARGSGVAAGCNAPEKLAARHDRALPGDCNNSNIEKGALGGTLDTLGEALSDAQRCIRTPDLYLTKVTLYQAELPRHPNGQSSQ